MLDRYRRVVALAMRNAARRALLTEREHDVLRLIAGGFAFSFEAPLASVIIAAAACPARSRPSQRGSVSSRVTGREAGGDTASTKQQGLQSIGLTLTPLSRMDRGSMRLAAALSRMQKRGGSRSRAGGCL